MKHCHIKLNFLLHSGDFKQCLPVVPRGGRSGVAAVSLNMSPLWGHVSRRSLTQSMRLAPGKQFFKIYLIAYLMFYLTYHFHPSFHTIH